MTARRHAMLSAEDQVCLVMWIPHNAFHLRSQLNCVDV